MSPSIYSAPRLPAWPCSLQEALQLHCSSVTLHMQTQAWDFTPRARQAGVKGTSLSSGQSRAPSPASLVSQLRALSLRGLGGAPLAPEPIKDPEVVRPQEPSGGHRAAPDGPAALIGARQPSRAPGAEHEAL